MVVAAGGGDWAAFLSPEGCCWERCLAIADSPCLLLHVLLRTCRDWPGLGSTRRVRSEAVRGWWSGLGRRVRVRRRRASVCVRAVPRHTHPAPNRGQRNWRSSRTAGRRRWRCGRSSGWCSPTGTCRCRGCCRQVTRIDRAGWGGRTSTAHIPTNPTIHPPTHPPTHKRTLTLTCTCTCTHTCTRTLTHTRLHAHTQTRPPTRPSTHARTHTHNHTQSNTITHPRTLTRTCTCTPTPTRTHASPAGPACV